VAASVSAKDRYEDLKRYRTGFLDRARQAAEITLPYIAPPEGSNESTEFRTPWQSDAAAGVRSLASKLLLSLFPQNTPFFKYAVDDLALSKLAEKAQAQVEKGKMDEALAARERAVLQEIETSLFRPSAFVAFQHLIVAGNYLIRVPVEGRAKGYRLDQYVVNRDPAGNCTEIVILEQIAIINLPKEIQDKVMTQSKAQAGNDRVLTVNETVDIYTYAGKGADPSKSDKWYIFQEVEGEPVGEEGWVTEEELEWIPIRLTSQPGEMYGRSLVEEFYGDIDTLEGLRKALVEGASQAVRTIHVVKPGSILDPKKLASAKNGTYFRGNPEDVTTIQNGKQGDYATAAQQADTIRMNLARVFLMNTAVQRNGERVTAEEIRLLASELDAALGGIYTLLSAEFQLPAVRLFERRMEKRVKVDKLPKELVQPTIVTGLEALGRGQDLNNLRSFAKDILGTLGPEVGAKVLNASEFIRRAAAAYGINAVGLVVPEEQLAQQAQMEQLMSMVQQGLPNAVTQVGYMGREAMQQDGSIAGTLAAAAAQRGGAAQPPQQ